MLQNRHSMTPMRREHAEIRAAGRGARPPAAAARRRPAPHRRDASRSDASSSASTPCSRCISRRSSSTSGIIEHGVSAERCRRARGGHGPQRDHRLLSDRGARSEPCAVVECRRLGPHACLEGPILPRQMDASNEHGPEPAPADTDALASDRDDAGVPVHRGWAPAGRTPSLDGAVRARPARRRRRPRLRHHRPARGDGHHRRAVDIGQVYRTLRDLEASRPGDVVLVEPNPSARSAATTS